MESDRYIPQCVPSDSTKLKNVMIVDQEASNSSSDTICDGDNVTTMYDNKNATDRSRYFTQCSKETEESCSEIDEPSELSANDDSVSTTTSSMTCKKDPKVCLVCGDKALGYNFNVVSCESCKAFFRRNAHKTIKGRCQGQCEVTVESRSFCRSCRLANCYRVGMRKEMILNKEQKDQRRQKIIINKLRKKRVMGPEEIYYVSEWDYLCPVPSTEDQSPSSKRNKTKQRSRSSASYNRYDKHYPPSSSSSSFHPSTPGNKAPITDIRMKQEDLSGNDHLANSSSLSKNENNAVDKSNSGLEKRHQPPSQQPWTSRHDDQVDKAIGVLPVEDQKILREVLHAMELTSFLTTSSSSLASIPSSPEEFVNIAENFVRKMIRLGKNIKSFKKLGKNDQVSLLKCSVVDAMMLRSAVNYDPFTETWSLNTGDCIDKGSGRASGERISANILANGSPQTRRLFMNYSKFIKSLMKTIHGDLLVLKTLIMISIFSADRLHIEHHSRVQEIQENYGRILESYVNARYAESTLFARIIMRLADLRNINELHSNMLLSMKMDKIEPLLLEIFDLHSCSVDRGSSSSSSGGSCSSSGSGSSGGSSSGGSSHPAVVERSKESSRHSPDSSTATNC